MSQYLIGIIASVLCFIAVGNYAGRKVKHLDDYYVAGRNAPTLLIVGTLVASFLSTNAFMGETGFAYEGYAFLMLVLVAVNSSGYVVGALFFGRYVRRSQALTIPEFFGKRFASRRVQAAAGLTTLIGLAAYLVAVTQGAALLVSEIGGLPYWQSLLLVWAGYSLFTLYSGSRGVVLTDTLMFLLFTAAAFLGAWFLLDATGGLERTVSELARFEQRPGILAWHGLVGENAYWGSPASSLGWALVLGLAWGTVVAVSPWQTSRYLMARNEQVVLRSACFSALILMLLYVVLMLMGAAINLVNPAIENPEKAVIWAAMNLMPDWLGVLLITGIMSAALSSCSTFLSLIGFSVTNDLVKLDLDEARMLRLSRRVMLASGLVSLAIAFIRPSAIMWITYFAGTLFASSWGPVAFMSVWSRRITAPAAFWGIVAGFVGNILASFLRKLGLVDLPVYLDPLIIGGLASLACILLISRHTRVSEAERRFLAGLHRTPEAERDFAAVSRTLLVPRLMMLGGVLLAAWLIQSYAIPFNLALAP
ncbi:sodium:solute symporter family protein [Metapseudomonas furukawaii]|jgi:sodium/pantothenate symporter|uniref:sodium:solute symporter family protein n=1 Tax=Metapseudomonas furukawaii TaxID=1149133 RepID=UPI00227D3518|nr:sodium:solute symporter family protein [Pseudomonas furukawaii]WAG77708.1 sodium:solute symporter family protein [Pseudomonas furukawaii]